MAEVVINDKVKTHEEGKHTYIGKYKGKDFKTSMQDMNDERELVYLEGEKNFTDEDKDIIFGSYGEHKFIVEEYSDEHGGDATFIEGEDNFNEEEQEIIYEAVNEYM